LYLKWDCVIACIQNPCHCIEVKPCVHVYRTVPSFFEMASACVLERRTFCVSFYVIWPCVNNVNLAFLCLCCGLLGSVRFIEMASARVLERRTFCVSFYVIWPCVNNVNLAFSLFMLRFVGLCASY